MSGLKILCEECQSGTVYVELQGYLDAHNFERLESFFEKYFAEGIHRFIADIRRVEYVSSAGAGVFIGAVGTCQDNGGNVVLVQPSQEVREIFELLGVYQIFPVAPSKERALEYFEEEAAEELPTPEFGHDF
ncbi:MAG TPA: STAS domain-containing protein [Planctomycetota bacterium]|nr:STAS domain-containing protein [Planctomycetota bacterium]